MTTEPPRTLIQPHSVPSPSSGDKVPVAVPVPASPATPCSSLAPLPGNAAGAVPGDLANKGHRWLCCHHCGASRPSRVLCRSCRSPVSTRHGAECAPDICVPAQAASRSGHKQEDLGREWAKWCHGIS